MRKLLGLLSFVALLVPGLAYAQATSSNDLCSFATRNTAIVHISSATDTEVVKLGANNAIYVCAYDITQAVGTGTVLLEQGTAASCGGTLTQIGPTFTANTSNPGSHWVSPPSNGTMATAATGDDLCVKSTGTIVQDVLVSYVQR